MLTEISKVIGYFQLAWNVLTEVKDLIQIIELSDTDDGIKHGKEKKSAVLDLIVVVYETADEFIDLPVEKSFITNLADKAIDIFVDIFNVIGQFRSKSRAQLDQN